MTAPPLARYFSDAENQGRGYIDPRDPTKAPVPGVTSIIKLVAKDMSQHGADMAIKWVIENWWKFNPGGKSDESAFRQARYRHKDFRDERAEIGTGVHAYIEDWINGREPDPEFYDVEQQQMIAQFHEAVFMTGMTFQSTEATVHGGDWAGTLDGHCTAYSERLGRYATGIVDFKTSRGIYQEPMMQLAALKNAKTMFRQVDKDTKGAYHVEDRNRGDSWWLVEDAPEVETAWVLQLRGDSWHGEQFVPAKWELIELEHEALHLKRFEALKTLWYVEKEMKQAGIDLKARLSS